MLDWIKRGWKAYCDWCDNLGLTPENRRCCAPRLQDPPLERRTSENVNNSALTGNGNSALSGNSALTSNGNPAPDEPAASCKEVR